MPHGLNFMQFLFAHPSLRERITMSIFADHAKRKNQAARKKIRTGIY
jgi:hypothetical protein